MTIKDGFNLFNKVPAPTTEPPASPETPAEALPEPTAVPAAQEPPKAAGSVTDGYTMFAGTRGAAYQAAHTPN